MKYIRRKTKLHKKKKNSRKQLITIKKRTKKNNRTIHKGGQYPYQRNNRQRNSKSVVNKCTNLDYRTVLNNKSLNELGTLKGTNCYKYRKQSQPYKETSKSKRCEDNKIKYTKHFNKLYLMLIIRHLGKARDLGGMLSGPNKDSIGKLACLFKLMEQSSIYISNLPHKEGDNNIKLCYKLIVENNYDEFIDYIKGYPKYYKELINKTISAVKNTLNSIK